MSKKAKFFISFGGLLFLFLISELIDNSFLKFNRSKSLPHTLFFSKKPKTISRGMYVSLVHPEMPSILIGKLIAGVPGDSIEIKGKSIFVNNQYLGEIKTRSKSGKNYRPIQDTVISEGHIFLFAPCEDSFDSRYQEFGLAEISWVKEELWPIF